MFKKILVANRGEIACRIITTLRRMNIKSVAIYSEADRGALFTDMADEAFLIGPAQAALSYLNIDKIVALCKEQQIDAVHPGYGFLAENPEFAEKLKANNITFIGPLPTCLKTLGDKIEAKKVAQKLNIPILSGDLSAASTVEQAKEQALKLGFPILIKAVAGGGGKGMRKVTDSAELKDAVQRAMGEAKSSFGDERIFIEKYLENPRHIEIQILGDQHGNILSLGERECSLQRRYQKLIEEAPSPFVDPELREKLGNEAKRLCKEVGYYSLGTVEFLLDENKNYYFLEINPRIQVEHPVTEQITGLDLVEQMIKVAAGEKLKIQQSDIKLTGWSIEARVCAESPEHGFMPSIGRLSLLNLPHSPYVRIDTGVVEGSEISPYYDSMIAKIISWGETREDARKNLVNTLNGSVIKGVDQNVSFLTAMVTHPDFIAGNFSTKFIEANFGAEFKPATPDDVLKNMMCRFAALKASIGHKGTEYVVTENGQEHKVQVIPTSVCSADITLDGGKTCAVTFLDNPRYGCAEVSSEGQTLTLLYQNKGHQWTLSCNGTILKLGIVPHYLGSLLRHIPEKREADQSQFVLSPMPGLLLSINVKIGDHVKNGEPLAIVEAMKMENVIRAHREGKIVKLHVKPGDSLSAEQPIVEFEDKRA